MATKPSLALIPSGVKASKVYSVLPSDGTGDFDFSRSGNATRVNKDGLIEVVGNNTPRLNYPMIDGVVSGCPSLLLEPERRNLIQYSEDFSQSYWTKTGSSITSDFISPDGTANAFKLVEDLSNGAHFISSTLVSFTIGSAYTISFFAKAGEVDYVKLQGDVGFGCIFNLSNGTKLQSADSRVISSEMIELTNGWYKCSITLQEASRSTDKGYAVLIKDGTSPSYTGDGTSGVYIYGAQVEQGSYPTSYIPNYGTALGVTRSAETCNGSGDANTFNDSEGVLMFDGYIPDDGNEKIIQLSNNTINTGVIRIFARGNGNDIRFQIVNLGSSTVSNELPLPSDNFYKLAFKYKTNDVSVWSNGFKLYTDTIATIPTGLNELLFGSDTGNPFYGKTKQIQYFDSALSDTELEKITSWTSFNEMANGQLYSII